MRGRNRWFRSGYGMGRGRGAFGWGAGYAGRAWPGNPYPYCRNFPWLPRGWWRFGTATATYPGTAGWPVGYGAYPANPSQAQN